MTPTVESRERTSESMQKVEKGDQWREGWIG